MKDRENNDKNFRFEFTKDKRIEFCVLLGGLENDVDDYKKKINKKIKNKEEVDINGVDKIPI